MPTQPEIASQIITQLGLVEPDLDLSIGTTIRKVIDAFSEAMAEGYVEQFFAGYQYDIDTLSGATLDAFLSIFGFTRFSAVRATGIITFARPTAATTNLFIPVGTTVANGATPPVTFTTLVSAILPIGGLTISIPVQAVVGGLGGNLPANTITNKVTPLDGVSTLTNQAATIGGADAESDDSVRARFKKTALRGYTGTEQMFLGTALENPNAIQANVVGSSKIHREQIQIIGGSGISTLRSAKFVYDNNYFFGPNLDTGDILNPTVDYSFSSGSASVPNPAFAPAVEFDPVVGSLTAPYSFCYTGIDGDGETLPSPVTSLSVNSVTGGQFTVTVLALSGATSYNIYVMPPRFVSGAWVPGGVWYKWANILQTDPLLGPTIQSSSVLPTGGSLADGTYYYRLTTVNGVGESLPGPEYSVVVSAGTGQAVVVLTFNNIPGSFGTNVYGRATGAEQLLVGTGRDFNASVPMSPGESSPGAIRTIAAIPGNVLSYVDAGQLTANGALPTLDSTADTVIFDLAAQPGATPTSLPTLNNTGFQPIITSLDSVNCPDGIYDLQFEYVPIASRNDPDNNITNRVDVYVQGTDFIGATDTIAFDTTHPFNSTVTSVVDPLNVINFQRPDGTLPQFGNYFQKLTFVPVTTLPATITQASTTWIQGIDYFMINDITPNGGTAHSNSGIEWVTSANGAVTAPPTSGTQLAVSYTYNGLPREVEISTRNWRLVSYDVQVHQAKSAFINVYMVVIIRPGFSLSGIQSAIEIALENLFSSVGFDGILQVSDILNAAANVPGVDAARMTTFVDNPILYALQRVSSVGTVIKVAAHNGRAYDLIFNDDTVPVFNSLTLTVKAQNSYWGGDDSDPGFSPPSI